MRTRSLIRWLAATIALITATVPAVAMGSPAALAATGPSDGMIFTVASVRSGKLVDVYGGSTADNTAVIQWPATGNANQQWITRATGTGDFTVVSVKSSKCLTVSGAATAAGAAVVQSACVGGATEQRWTFTTTADGVSTIRSVRSTLCLDVTANATADGAVIEQWTCTGGSNQQWLLTPVAPPQSAGPVGIWGPGMSPGGIRLADQTVREIVHTAAGGSAPQLRLTNLFGGGSLTVGHVDLAVQSSGGTAVPGTHHRLTFGGATTATLAVGQEQWSDPVAITLNANQNLLVSVYVSNTVASTTWHSDARGTTWLSAAGDHAAEDGTGNYPTTNGSWFLIDGLTVTNPTATGTVVTFGDSITDGALSTSNANNRYPDYLARRLATGPGGPKLGVMNVGIGGNRVLTDGSNTSGASALHRFSRDALTQPGVRSVILLEGINDLRGTTVTAQSIIAAYRTLIDQAHAAGVAIYGGTILPCGGATSWTTGQDNQRNMINSWIRTSGAFDGVVDFDAAIRDPASPSRMLPAYDSGDHLHPGNAGYQAMANAVDLGILRS